MTTKEIKQLNGIYKKSFKTIQSTYTIDTRFGLKFFVEYLRYLRDFIILNNYKDNSADAKFAVASIIAVIAEYDAYNASEEPKQRDFHWCNFCELIKQNMEDWLSINDSV